MRKNVLVLVTSAVVVSFTGCTENKAPEAAPAVEVKQAALEVKAPEAKPVEAEKAPEAAPVAEAKDVLAPAEAAKTRIKLFVETLTTAGFASTGMTELLPDMLGGIEDCAALLRTKVETANGYATLGQYADDKTAEACLAAYLKTPGASKYAHLYTRQGAFILELQTDMKAVDMSKVREIFSKVAQN